MSAPSSPTLCRPQHIDRERLRRLLTTEEFVDVRYHEAVVVVEGEGRSPGFKLLAVTSDAMLLFPLGSSSGSGSLSPSRATEVHPTPSASSTRRVLFRDVLAVDRASPTAFKLKGIMINATSELFQVEVFDPRQTEPRSLFVATFEPASRAFFYVARSVHVEFQKRIMHPTTAIAVDDDAEKEEGDGHSNGDLHDLLEELVEELVSHSDDTGARCQLLHELATAVMRTQALQTLCFQDQSGIETSITHQADVTYGLPTFVLEELSRLVGLHTRNSETQLLEYQISLLLLLHRLLFGGHWVPQRRRFFLQTPLTTWLRVATLVPRISKPLKTEQWRLMAEDLVDLQTALLLEVQLLQEEAVLLDDASYLQQYHTVTQLLLSSDDHDEWISKLFKRFVVSLSRAPKEHHAALTSDGSPWSLSLWRSSSLLVVLLQTSCTQDNGRLAATLSQRRRDYLDLYLRNPRFHRVLESSTNVPHLIQVADNLVEILDFFS